MDSLPIKIIWTVTALILAAWIAYMAVTIPVVLVSRDKWLEIEYISDNHASHADMIAASCVRVSPPSAGSCTNIPTKYELIWSK